MASSTSKPFRRMASFSERFKVRKTKGYQQWEEEGLMAGETDQPSILVDQDSPCTEDHPDCERSLELSGSNGGGVEPAASPTTGQWVPEVLAECFYLGYYDMAGLSIRGRGCIDYPAGSVWQQTQQDESGSNGGAGGLHKPRRKNSWSPRQKYESRSAPPQRSVSSGSPSKPRYVRLVAEKDALVIVDDHNAEKIDSFNYRKISFVGTHPKYVRLFAFVAESSGKKAYCHAFKCESKESADKTACGLSDVFQRKIKEIQAAKKQTIEITASATVLN